MVAGIVGIMIFVAPLLAALTAIVTGLMARKQILRSEGALKGRGMAMTGIVCGALSLLIAAGATALFVVMAASMARNAQSQRSEMLDTIDEAEAAAGSEAGAADAASAGTSADTEPFEAEEGLTQEDDE